MISERDWSAAFCAWAENKDVLVLFRERNVTLTFEEYMELMHRYRKVVFLVDDLDPEELHTDEEFMEQFEAVPEEPKPMSRAEKRHMIETLAAEGSMGVSEIAARVGCSVATVRKYIKCAREKLGRS